MKISPLNVDKPTYTFGFSFDDKFAECFSVALSSLTEHKKDGCIYEIIVLHGGLSDRIINVLKSMTTDQVVLRFYNVADYVHEVFGDLAGKVSSDQWEVSTFYNLLVPLIMPDYERVLFCDADLVFCEDPVEFFSLPFNGMQLTAAKDTLSLGTKIPLDGSFLRKQIEFVKHSIGLERLENYFNAGVLLFNIPAIDRKKYLDRVQHALSFPVLPTVDQDVLNYVFRDHVNLLSPRYNLQAWMLKELQNCDGSIPEAAEFLKDAERPMIIHYSTGVKPWKMPNCPKKEQFWLYAGKSPFFENILNDFHGTKWRKEISAFSVKRYLISRILSKFLPGKKRMQYQQEYKSQRRIYDRIRSGN